MTDGNVMDTDDELPGMLALAKGVSDQRWPHTMDAMVWANKWMEMTKDRPDIPLDHGMMLAWFANAIMAGYDTANMHAATPSPDSASNTRPSV